METNTGNDETDTVLEFTDISESVVVFQNDQAEDKCYRTTHAMQIAKVIGHTPDLATFDKLRSQMKRKQLKSHEEYSKHDKLLAALQKAILTERSFLMDSITHIEQRHFQLHGSLPTEISPSRIYRTTTQIQTIKQTRHSLEHLTVASILSCLSPTQSSMYMYRIF